MMAKARGKRTNSKVIAVVLIVIVVIGAAIIIATTRSNTLAPVQKSLTIQVPSDWQTSNLAIQSGLSIKTPDTWLEGGTSTFIAGDDTIRATYVSPDGNSPYGINTPYVSITLDKLTDKKGEVAFEKAMADPKSKTITGLYGTTSRGTIPSVSTTVLNINGVRWLQRDINNGNQLARLLYYWQNDHAVGISMVSNDSNPSTNTQHLNQLTTQYLYPIAASLQTIK